MWFLSISDHFHPSYCPCRVADDLGSVGKSGPTSVPAGRSTVPKAREVILGWRSVPAWTLFIEKEAFGTDSVVTVLRLLSLFRD